MANKKTPADPMVHLAISSCPIQTWGDVYDLETGLKEGTIFPALNKVFWRGESNGK